MTIELPSDAVEFLDDQVASGAFASHAEAVTAAVSLLRQQAEWLHHVDEGQRQLETGDFEEYDDTTLAQRFEELKQKASAQGERQE